MINKNQTYTLVKNKSFKELCQLNGYVVNFKSSCEFFPNFDVVGRVTNIMLKNDETIFTIKTHPTNKEIKIGSNMHQLRYLIMQ